MRVKEKGEVQDIFTAMKISCGTVRALVTEEEEEGMSE